jgi:hypothetical protein
MALGDRSWGASLLKGIASLAVALTITFLPMLVNNIRARRQAAPVEIIASPGVVADTLGSAPCPAGANNADSASACDSTGVKK